MTKRLLHYLLALCCLCCLTGQVHGQTRITVLSDIHVMASELVEQDGAAWQAVLRSDRKLLDYSQAAFDLLIAQTLDEHPDMVLITGDLTKDGELLSHQHVVSQLDRLRDAGIKCFVIPGNHDLGTVNAQVFRGDQTAPAVTADSAQFAALYRNYGYGAGSRRCGNTLTYSCEPADGLTLIGIDSGPDGLLAAATLDWVCRQAEQARTDGRRVLVMIHHALMPHFAGEDRLVPGSVVQHCETVRNRLADAGVQVVLTGHIHISDIAKDFSADLSRPIYDVSTGSPISYPCDYRRLTLSADRTLLAITTGRITSLPRVGNFGGVAKQRLRRFLSAYARRQLKSRPLSTAATSVFLAHAEGNENKSEEAQGLLGTFNLGKFFLGSTLKSKLAARGVTWSELAAAVKSMLTDTTSLGIDGRENRTDDLKLTITLTD